MLPKLLEKFGSPWWDQVPRPAGCVCTSSGRGPPSSSWSPGQAGLRRRRFQRRFESERGPAALTEGDRPQAAGDGRKTRSTISAHGCKLGGGGVLVPV